MSQKAPQVSIGDAVRYYLNGWRYGHITEIRPRKKQARIKPAGPGRAIWIGLANVEAME